MKTFEKLTRRTFIKGLALAGAAVAATSQAGLVPADKAYAEGDPTKTEIVSTVCRACLASCAVLAHVRDGRIIKVEGDPRGPLNRGKICLKSLSGTQAVYNPMRQKYPMVRVGERGGSDFKRVSWDEALGIIADKLMEVREKYGAETVFTGTGGGGNPHISGPARFAHAFGTPNFMEPGSSLCYLPRQVATWFVRGPGYVFADLAFYRAMNDAYFADEGETEAVVLWGGAPTQSTTGQAGQAIIGLLNRQKPPAKLVVIDPRWIPEAQKAEVWLPIRPGSDVALMMCWIKYIIDKELFDVEFCKKWSNLPFLIDPDTQYPYRGSEVFADGNEDDYVVWDTKTNSAQPLPFPYNEALDAAFFGEYTVNGKRSKTGFQLIKDACDEFTLEKAAEICWLDPVDIEKAIRVYTDNKSCINHGVATDQNINSSSAALCAMILEVLQGQIESPGAATQRFGELVPTAGIMCDDTFGLGRIESITDEETLLKRLGGIEYKGMGKWHECHLTTLLEAIKDGKPYQMKVWLERSTNKFNNLARPDVWYEACKNLEFVVHACLYPTTFTIACADVILPMREWLETPKPVLLGNLLFARRAVTHIFETCEETVMWGKLAKACADRGHENCRNAFDADYTAPNVPLRDTEAGVCATYMADSPYTWDELLEIAPVEVASFEDWHQYYVYKTINPKTGKPHGFNTPTMRCEPYSDAAVLLGRTGRPWSIVRGDNGGQKVIDLPPASKDYHAVPYYVEPDETPATDGAQYPLIQTSGRIATYHHGTLRNIPWLREIMPHAECWLHPDDAAKYGIKDKEWVKVESKRGFCHAMSRITKAIRPGVTYQERFWYPELQEKDPLGSFAEQNINMCTKDDGNFDEMHGTSVLRGFQVKVTPAPDFKPSNWSNPKDFAVWLPEPSDRTEEV
jgi:anaerobic selenocysteine-containing dehydrogenase